MLGGYRKHVAECLAWMYWSVPRHLRLLAAPLVQHLPFRFRDLKIAVASLNCDDWRERYVRWFGAMDFQQRRELSRLRVHERDMRDDLPPFDSHPDASSLRRMLYFDQTSWLPDNLLERGDRMTMAASIEARVPFLDHKLVEFASALPDHWRVDDLRRKRVLREVGRSLLPREIPERKKVGFRVPVTEWFTGGMRDYLYDHLYAASSLTRAYYNAAVISAIRSQGARFSVTAPMNNSIFVSNVEHEFGHPVLFEELEIPAGRTATATVTYRVPHAAVDDGGLLYQARLIAQPAVWPASVTVTITLPHGPHEVAPGMSVSGSTVTWRGAADRSRSLWVRY